MSEQEYVYGVKELESIIRRIESGNCTQEQKKQFEELFMAGMVAVRKGE